MQFLSMYKAEVIAISQLDNMDAELLEFVVNQDSKICNKVVRDLNFQDLLLLE